MNRLTLNSSSSLPEALQSRLNRKRQENTFRRLSPRQGIDFSSNDYLALSEDPVLRSRLGLDVSLGSTASRLLRGNLPLYEETEKDLATFCGSEAALLFPSGYQCNLGVLSALAGPEDCFFSDELNHASIIDGIRLSGAAKKIYPHFNLVELEKLLVERQASDVAGSDCSAEGPLGLGRPPSGLKIIVTESLFSMDGDVAPLRELAGLAAKYNAVLIVDEAHATGLWGSSRLVSRGHSISDTSEDCAGAGWVAQLGLRAQVFATLHTGGKALGVGGAWVALSASAKEYLVNFSRPFIFSTAPLPLVARSLQLALGRWREVGPERVLELRTRIRFFKQELEKEVGFFKVNTAHPESPIVPLQIGANQPCLEIADLLQKKGFDVRAIRPPTVAEGSARLRITLHWHNSEQDLSDLARALAGVGCSGGLQ